jgi:hypothetical protein
MELGLRSNMFGLASPAADVVQQLSDGFRFAAVDDGNNILDVWNVR